MNCTNFRSPASYERITAAAILTVVSKLILHQNLCTKPKSRDNDRQFSLFPNRKTAHKAVIIVNTMMNEKGKEGRCSCGYRNCEEEETRRDVKMIRRNFTSSLLLLGSLLSGFRH